MIAPVSRYTIVAASAYTSVHVPILSVVEYSSSGEKPRLTTGCSVALPPVVMDLTAPKSSSFAVPSCAIMMLSGLTSRWTNPR